MDKFNYLKEQLTAALATWQQTNGGKTTVGWMHAANPEVIAALLAELKAAEQRIAELEKRLATPVRLLGEMLLHDWEHSVERQATFQHRKIAWDARLAEDKKAILAAGFTFTVEGDE